MSDEEDEKPGYGRPPMKNRWKLGQSGNSGRRNTARKPDPLQLLERKLAERITITSNGEDRKVSKLEAILWQLYAKMLSGDRRALAVLTKYEKFAALNSKKAVELVFVENDYTQAFADRAPKHDDEQ
jgi:hypothetical protein